MHTKRPTQKDIQRLQMEMTKRDQMMRALYPAGDFFCENYDGLLVKQAGRVDIHYPVNDKPKAEVI